MTRHHPSVGSSRSTRSAYQRDLKWKFNFYFIYAVVFSQTRPSTDRKRHSFSEVYSVYPISRGVKVARYVRHRRNRARVQGDARTWVNILGAVVFFFVTKKSQRRHYNSNLRSNMYHQTRRA